MPISNEAIQSERTVRAGASESTSHSYVLFIFQNDGQEKKILFGLISSHIWVLLLKRLCASLIWSFFTDHFIPFRVTGRVLDTITGYTFEWDATSLQGSMWAMEGSVPCSKLPWWCYEGVLAPPLLPEQFPRFVLTWAGIENPQLLSSGPYRLLPQMIPLNTKFKIF